MNDLQLIGKGMYIWPVIYCEDGDPQRIAQVAQAAGLSHVLIKVADGINNYNVSADLDAVIAALRTAIPEIKILAWQYVYGKYPLDEARRAVARLKRWRFDGFVADIEGEFKSLVNAAAAARIYFGELRGSFPLLPIGTSTYRYPSLHQEIPFKVIEDFIDFHMPQVYWMGAHNPGAQLERCVQEYRKFSNKPIYPTGAAYRWNDWAATPAEVIEFMAKARALDLQAANYWEWMKTRRDLPAVWAAIADYDWPAEQPTPTPEPDPILERVATLEQAVRELMDITADLIGRVEALENAEPVIPPVVPPEEPPADYAIFRVRVDKTNARSVKSYNAAGKPIMQIYPNDASAASQRVQFFYDEHVKLSPVVTTADGGYKYHELMQPVNGVNVKLYISKDDVIKTS